MSSMETWADLNLKAGMLDLHFSKGMLRYLHLNNSEAVRGVYFAVRDKNWNTDSGTTG